MAQQQRTSAVRRVRPNVLGAQYNTLDWTAAVSAAAEIDVTPFNDDGTDFDFETDFALEGLPPFQLLGVTNPLLACVFIKGTSVVLPSVFRLTFTDPIGPGNWFLRLPANRPEIRGAYGSYLAGHTHLNQSVPATDNIALSATNVGTGVDIGIDAVPGQLYTADNPPVANTTAGTTAILVTITGTNVHVTFPAPPAPGDVIDWGGGAPGFLNPTGGGLAGFSFVL